MKSLNEILNEGILDDDFDTDDNAVYIANIKEAIIDLIENPKVDDIDAKFEEISKLLKDIADIQRADKTSIMKKMRMKDNTCIWIHKLPYEDKPYKICIRRFIQNPRPFEICLTMHKENDGTGTVYVTGPYKCNHLSQINPSIAKYVVFASTAVWDDIAELIPF